MRSDPTKVSINDWTIRKPVTLLAIAPQNESLTRAGRLLYNVMVSRSQHSAPDSEGWFAAPLSELVRGYGATTRDSARVTTYMEQLCTTLVRWFPLSPTDQQQWNLLGGAGESEAKTFDSIEEGRVFALLSEVRFFRTGGEKWAQWFFPPTIRELVCDPTRWGGWDVLAEQAKLSTYASVSLFEVFARYKDSPGGLTNRASPMDWQDYCRSDPTSKAREWRKFKNETLNRALAEICARTSIDVKLIEFKQGRVVSSCQFMVRKKASTSETPKANLELLTLISTLGIREKDFDLLLDEFSENSIREACEAMSRRILAKPDDPIQNRAAYLRRSLKNADKDEEYVEKQLKLDSAKTAKATAEYIASMPNSVVPATTISPANEKIDELLYELPESEIERLAGLAMQKLSGPIAASLQKRFIGRQYRLPMIWRLIRAEFALECNQTE